MLKYTVPISIVMPSFNSEKYILKAIHSLLTQTFDDFELIIVDDGSSDCTTEIISSITDNRIKLLKNKQNLGNYPTRNRGIFAASGKYIAMMDSDDIAMPNRLLTQYNYLEKRKHVGVVGSHYNVVDQNGDIMYVCNGPSRYEDFKICLLRNNCMLQSSIMIRRYLVVKHNLIYNTKYKYSSDYDFVRRCSLFFPIFNIPEILVFYRRHEEQISSKKTFHQHKLGQLIREQQFSRIGIKKNSKGMQLINKVMNNEELSEIELESSCDVLNSVLELNSKKKYYSQNKLHNFFQSLLISYITRN